MVPEICESISWMCEMPSVSDSDTARIFSRVSRIWSQRIHILVEMFRWRIWSE